MRLFALVSILLCAPVYAQPGPGIPYGSTSGIRFKGVWDTATLYYRNDVVTKINTAGDVSSFRCKAIKSIAHAPISGVSDTLHADWEYLAQAGGAAGQLSADLSYITGQSATATITADANSGINNGFGVTYNGSAGGASDDIGPGGVGGNTLWSAGTGGAAAGTQVGGQGGAATFRGGVGGAGAGAAAGAGGSGSIRGGVGGAASASVPGGVGGTGSVLGGQGGAGTAGQTAGAGGAVVIVAGAAGTAGAGGGNDGGTVSINGGNKSGSGTAGKVQIGTVNSTSEVNIGQASTIMSFFGAAAVAQPSAYNQTAYSTATKTVPNITTHTISDGSTGVASTSAIAAVTNPDLSAWNGSVDPTAAQATAINAAITSLKNAVATLAAELALTKADLLANKKLINALIDDLQALGLAQ